jgi:DNA-binding PadR family transcriptional regulator
MHEKLHQRYWGGRPEAPDGGPEGGHEPHFRLHHRPPFGGGPRGPRGGPARLMWAAGMGRRQQVRRGDVRAAILAVLADKPMHGYQVMQELGQRSGGAWTPSAGSVYPTLQQLEDEGLVHGEEQEGRRVYSLTDQGRETAAKASGTAPWDLDAEGDQDARQAFMLLAQAAMQVYQVGNAAQIAEARTILVNARRELYGLLARDEGGASEPGQPGAGDDGNVTDSGDAEAETTTS